MKWNKQGAQFQRSRKGTSKAHEYFFITTVGAMGAGWLAGYRGIYRLVLMNGAGFFRTPEEARAYCEKIDRKKNRVEREGK